MNKKKEKSSAMKAADAFFYGLSDAMDSVAGAIQNGVFGGVKQAKTYRKGYKPYRTLAERKRAKKRAGRSAR